MEKQTNIPALRFPEFKGEWEKKKLGKISNGIMYGMNSSAMNYDGENKYLRITDIDESSRTFLPNPLTSPDGNIEERFKLKVGDIVFTRTGASVGKSYLYKVADGNLLFAGFLIKFSIIGANPYFIFSQTLMPSYDKWVQKMSMRSGQPGINAEEYKELEISFPTLPEQQKIASFFTAIDEKIQALKQKKELLQQYKKGIMQQLFTQQLRFKDENGQEYPDWEEKKLGEVGETFNGLSGKNKEHFGNGKPYIQYKQIFDDSKIDISRFELVEIEENEKQSKVLFGDVFFTISSETPNEIGTASVLLDRIDELYLNSFCFGYRANSLTQLCPYFSRYLFRSALFRTEIIKLAQGSTRYNMSKVQLLKIKILMPTYEEQTKIANFLSSLDEKINHTQTQIQQATQWKKGLLQTMFC